MTIHLSVHRLTGILGPYLFQPYLSIWRREVEAAAALAVQEIMTGRDPAHLQCILVPVGTASTARRAGELCFLDNSPSEWSMNHMHHQHCIGDPYKRWSTFSTSITHISPCHRDLLLSTSDI